MKRLLVVAAALMLVLPASAASNKTSGRVADLSTKEFVKKAAMGNTFEIEAARVGERRVHDAAYRDFAEMIVSDHTKAGNELKAQVSHMNGIEMPTKLDLEHQQMIQMLRSETGANFEQQYREGQIQAHEVAIKLFQDYAQNGGNSDLMTRAKDTVPALEKHLQRAQALPMPPAPAVGEAQPQQPSTTGKAPAHRH